MKRSNRTLRNLMTGGAVVLTSALGTAGIAAAASTPGTHSTTLTIAGTSGAHDQWGDPANRPPRPDLTPLTGAALASATASATAAVPNATVVHAVAGPNGTYGVLLKTTSGGHVTVIENSSFVVISTHQGFGPRHPGGPGDPSTMRHGPGETPLTGAELASAEASATAAVPNATVIRAESDAQGAAYEVHMKKADGTFVTVKENTSFVVTSTESGFGTSLAGAPDQPPAGPQN